MFSISAASADDIPQLLLLVNSAYRGEASRKGWTTEADFLDGDLRIDAENLAELLKKERSVVLKYTTPGQPIQGCVYLDKRDNRLYLGMLSVLPELQARGIGKELLAAAAQHAVNTGCTSIYMRVLSKRSELIAWYERHGYTDTGAREPYDAPPKFGIFKEALEFLILEKKI